MLSDYTFQNELTLHLILCHHGGTQLLVKILIDNTIILDIEAHDTIGNAKVKETSCFICIVKAMFQNKEGIHLDPLCMLFAGMKLMEYCTLFGFNIQKESILHLALCLHGIR